MVLARMVLVYLEVTASKYANIASFTKSAERYL